MVAVVSETPGGPLVGVPTVSANSGVVRLRAIQSIISEIGVDGEHRGATGFLLPRGGAVISQRRAFTTRADLSRT